MAALIRVYVAFLAAGQVQFERHGLDADPWMTLVGYFNSLRELGGMKRLVDDDVRTRHRKMADRGLANRTLYTPDTVKELTSRLGATAIPETLDLLESRFEPVVLDQIKKGKGTGGEFIARPLDVLLATNMISVGVPHGPNSVCPYELHQAGKAASGGPRSLHRGLQERPLG